MRRPTILTAVLATALLLPLGAQAAEEDYVPADPTFDALPGATAYSGIEEPTDGDDWAWQIEVPDEWNGVLVLYAHGFVTPTQTELIVQAPPLRPGFIGGNFAWAASSYSANGYEIERGVEETHELLRIFSETTESAPAAVIIHGVSMGGHITGVFTERYEEDIDAALPACGVMGDTALYDYFNSSILTAHALSGVPAEVPIPADYLARVAPGVISALGLGSLPSHSGFQWGAVLEQLSGGERPGFPEAFAFWNGDLTAVGPYPFLFGVAGGGLTGGPDNRALAFFDNSGTTYSFDGDATTSAAEMMLNARTTRLANSGDPFFPVITGDIGVPVLSLHTVGDMFVPFEMERVYAQRVADAEKSDLLTTRITRSLGHCEFSAEEIGTAFGDLVGWMMGAPKPAGDDVLDAAAVADPDFGCTFSAGITGTRALLPACDADVAAARAAGEDRIETAIAFIEGFGTADTVVLARSDDPVDALTGASLAGVHDAPVLLTGGAALDARVATAIEDLGASTVILLGGTSALSAQVATDAAAIDGVATVTRIEGATRYDTAASIADEVGGTHAYVVSGSSSADALSLGALAAFTETPILLTGADDLPGETAEALSDLGVTAVTIVGGTAVVSADVADQIESIVGSAPTRLSGDDRYGTSAAVVSASVSSGMDVMGAHLASGTSEVDALAAGPAAAHLGQVLALVNGTSADDLGAAADLLAGTGRVLRPLIAGGVAVVTEAVETALEAALDNA